MRLLRRSASAIAVVNTVLRAKVRLRQGDAPPQTYPKRSLLGRGAEMRSPSPH
ncbi:MAG: hypothetical protein AB4290_08980 [Spirulina sp.]